MKTFLAVFTGTPDSREASGWSKLSEADRKAREQQGMAAWHAWMSDHAKEIPFEGGPLGKTKLIDKKGVRDITNALVGFTILHADSHEAAAREFENHPHFAIFPGEAVEIMEILPIPGR